MRTRPAMLVLIVAAVLGVVTGVVLPGRDRPGVERADPASAPLLAASLTPSPPVPSSGPSAGSATPSTSSAASSTPSTSSAGSSTPSRSSAGSSTPSTSSAGSATPHRSSAGSATPSTSAEGSVTNGNLLTAADFAEVGLQVGQRSSNHRLELTRCSKTGRSYTTLAEVANSGPPVQRLFEAEHVSAAEQAVFLNVAEDSEAAAILRDVLDVVETCQRSTPTYGYLGPTRTERPSRGVTVSWLGWTAGQPDQRGAAPSDAGIDGGVAVLRHGRHLAVLDLGLCASAGESYQCTKTSRNPEEILAALSRTAAARLG